MTKRWTCIGAFLMVLAFMVAAMSGCMPSTGSPEEGAAKSEKPEIPEKLELQDGIPMLKVYNTSAKKIQEMDIESYVQGVLAGEMRNDWPMEALKAQAILARTFVLKFVSEKKSSYSGADISTDIKEAQAYDESAINSRIVQAVNETRGEVMSYDGTFPFSWFHAHAGGQTELPGIALDYKDGEPSYTKSVESPDSDKAPEDVKRWSVSFSAKEVGDAAAEAGTRTGNVTSIEMGKKGTSGRPKELIINGKAVSAPSLRIALGSTKVKSTLFDEVKLEGGKVVFSGKGYGHGVGMSQWGAYGMADEGKDAEAIVKHYFDHVEIVNLWK